MNIFVCEFVTGGGLYREALPPSLAHEGDLMLRALLTDLLAIPGVHLATTRDARLPALELPVAARSIGPEDDAWACWQHAMAAADAIWLIAPETGGLLERMSRMVMDAGKRLLGSSPDAVAVAARKSATSALLAAAGIDVVATRGVLDIDFTDAAAWVVKPDDGAGCEDTVRFVDSGVLNAWLRMQPGRTSYVAQPCLQGVPASFSMLCRDGRSWLLSCNRQLVRLEHDVFSYHGSLLNDMTAYSSEFEQLGRRIAAAMPGLAGYVGVDVMVSESGVTVLEINPRLTTSYVGMHRATGQNPAGLVLDMFYNDNFELPDAIKRIPVEISLDEF